MTAGPTRVLAVDDEPDSAEWLRIYLQQHGYDVRTASDAPTSEVLCSVWRPDLVLLDLVLGDVDGLTLLGRIREIVPEAPVIVVSGRATVGRAVDALTAGAFSLIEKPVDGGKLLGVMEKAQRLRDPVIPTEPEEAPEEAEAGALGGIVTRCPRIRGLFEMIRVAAPTDANVLILGENGTGKELVATAIHELSARREGPFVKINCAAIPSELLESELFGHRKGAFTGATGDRRGLLEAAHRGSILLDEIAEMPTHLQVKLLRVLQERHFRPVGGTSSVTADFRLICSTNSDPMAAVQQGQLRQDLFFRINTVTLDLPPLRDRQGDIPLLARHFLQRFGERHQRNSVRGFHESAMRALERHAWPGNVRELEHVIERAVILASGPNITMVDLPDAVKEGPARRMPPPPVPAGCTLEEVERLAIVATLELTGGNKRAAADMLGIHRPTLYNKLRKYRLWGRPEEGDETELK